MHWVIMWPDWSYMPREGSFIMVSNTNELSHEAFLYLIRQSGIDLDTGHDKELFDYVKSVLTSLDPLRSIDVGSTAPPMMFIPAQEDV